MENLTKGMPNIVSPSDWEKKVSSFQIKEKELTYAKDRLNAERRRLPMTQIEKAYNFDSPEGKVNFSEIFEGRRQLIVYHFMYHQENDSFCSGCSMFVDQIGHLAHLNARNTSFALISRGPVENLERHRERMGWDIPWYSSLRNDFNLDFGLSSENGETFGLSVFIQNGGHIYHSYSTNRRGVEALGNVWSLLDLTPWGRQEDWEDSPEGVPQAPAYQWWRLHDEYK